jgi:cellulose synthase/poly-beta-1,6-N-acetylglucosamine synthase-like glycosyltransferase
MATLGVIIPCRNDCDAAERLLSTFSDQTVQPDEFVIGHDKCVGKDNCLQLGNKAATINFYAKQLGTDYILILDADMVLTPTFFEALKVAFERNKPTVGSGVVYSLSEKTVAMKNRLVGYGSVPMCWYWFGGCMYVERSFLVTNPMPTETVLEDIVYGKLLEKRGVKAEFVPNAVCFMWRKNETVMRQLRRQIRFMLGSFEQTRYHLSRYTLALYSGIVGAYALSLLAVFRFNVYVGFILFLGYTLLIALYYCPNSSYEKNGFTFALAYSLMWFPICCYALSLFIMRKKIW